MQYAGRRQNDPNGRWLAGGPLLRWVLLTSSNLSTAVGLRDGAVGRLAPFSRALLYAVWSMENR